VRLQRRGFLNAGNTCYLNASLQALLGCSAFSGLLRLVAPHATPKRHAGLSHTLSRLPTLRALAALAAEYSTLAETLPLELGVARPVVSKPGASPCCLSSRVFLT